MGKKEKATYVCDACGEHFNYEQAQQYLERPSLPALENTPR
jgi:DNA-directed RNA polymerase subunit RPC12/RpoP